MFTRESFVKILLFTLIIAMSVQGCVSYKDLVTLNGNEQVSKDMRSAEIKTNTRVYPFKPHQIQPFDQLMIRINAFDGSTEEFLNREFTTEHVYSKDINYDPPSLYFNSYTVDGEGNIYLPLLDKVLVKGVTLSELKVKLDKDYSPYLKFASTNVKLANMRVTVIGEVNDPGVHYLHNERATLLDAIGLAGDFTNFGNRKKVKVIRQNKESSYSSYLNMNRDDFIYTEFYYCKPYDVIYVEPLKAKSWDVSTPVIGVVLSAISVAALLLNFFKR
ncbi:MAG: polysaccharide biosynthesis/export family protein [Saprospiraceae bacterium]|nr:polysaccharide biosynthesis/export family protein [Saprospiraceae bacterium]MCF8250839.1 polysaccharide biosynthesis/export family protein [Saprospiraceae bacterium]MCF8281656.1 polysaccharide biosynthesis/export family protein [Bacteroidales bacterium]MCF8312640.1 polysaccharide biosynthesis/export family protein [Saprospiraceae bacterium]MCF8441030.1 polysaccharide biosynthesis/export family protein [Saprospiraceae bacterium]